MYVYHHACFHNKPRTHFLVYVHISLLILLSQQVVDIPDASGPQVPKYKLGTTSDAGVQDSNVPYVQLSSSNINGTSSTNNENVNNENVSFTNIIRRTLSWVSDIFDAYYDPVWNQVRNQIGLINFILCLE